MNKIEQLEIFQKLLKYYKDNFVEASKYKSIIDLHKFYIDNNMNLGLCYCAKNTFSVDIYENVFLYKYLSSIGKCAVIYEYPERQYNVMDINESVRKRIEFLEYAVKTLQS